VRLPRALSSCPRTLTLTLEKLEAVYESMTVIGAVVVPEWDHQPTQAQAVYRYLVIFASNDHAHHITHLILLEKVPGATVSSPSELDNCNVPIPIFSQEAVLIPADEPLFKELAPQVICKLDLMAPRAFYSGSCSARSPLL
jgi:hypothetical protein